TSSTVRTMRWCGKVWEWPSWADIGSNTLDRVRRCAASSRRLIEVRREKLGHERHERLHPARNVATMGVHERHRHRLRPEIRQHLDQLAPLDQPLKPDSRCLNDAEAREARGPIGVGTAHRHRTVHGDRAVYLAIEVLEAR